MTLRELKRQNPDVYLWTKANFDEDFGCHPISKWYRSPLWGRYIIWNKRYGFQLYTDVGHGVVKMNYYIVLNKTKNRL